MFHLYVFPFIFLYSFWIYIYKFKYDKYIKSEEWTFITLGTLFSVQGILWLSKHWNVHIKTLLTAKLCYRVEEAQLIRITPVSNQGLSEICVLNRKKFENEAFPEIYFFFQKKKFVYSYEKKKFQELSFRIDSNPLIEDLQAMRGLTSDTLINYAKDHYGYNRFDIPVLTFVELFKEHAVAPFFVFQVFCVALWCLDEYWYYSLFTLLMLILFESTVVWQRQKTLTEFRTMSIKSYQIYVYRKYCWTQVMTDELFPDDIVSIAPFKEEHDVPCDMILLSGTCIINEAMLSGESTPLLKENISLRDPKSSFDIQDVDRNSLLFGGTKILQISPSTNSAIPLAPDNGALAVVIKTGFETQQGNLVRTMIYSTERVSANNLESLFFILFLLVFAIAASCYVWTKGIQSNRNKYKLLLDCILIITSVVPPELPMELSLAVNSSLATLSKLAIFCTEPFRIPFAGRIDVCCFDKTGTLTEEDLVVKGVAGLSENPEELVDVNSVSKETMLVLGTAHSLIKLDDGKVIGDPMEKATLDALKWKLEKNNVVLSSQKELQESKIEIVRRFQFSLVLKRQSSIVTISDQIKKSRKTFVAVKGAPEVLEKISIVPKNYESIYRYFTKNGCRVLALGYKFLKDQINTSEINLLSREEIESNLIFSGFLVFSCSLKRDAASTIKMLNESSHRVIMITGDNPLTACHVAREVQIIERDVLILDSFNNGLDLCWKNIDNEIIASINVNSPLDKTIFQKYDICVTGYALSKYYNSNHINDLLRHTWIYARVSPAQKERILISLKEAGYITLMCGDGTNDVGALKQAHIGVALLNGSEEVLKRIEEHARNEKLKQIYEKQVKILAKFNKPPLPVPFPIAYLYSEGPFNPHREASILARSKNIEASKNNNKPNSNKTSQNKLQVSNITKKDENFTETLLSKFASFEDDTEPPVLKLGDASCAAPFTSKLSNVVAIANIIRQGRCTLVATIQMYKILALNCLISAYSLSVLYLDGIKFGDGQITISGMLMSACFLYISKAKPVQTLSKERPQSNIFNIYIIGSILGQFLIHILTLIYIKYYVSLFETPIKNVDLESEFSPSLLNSAIYLLQFMQQISTFTINYQGQPFRESIQENKIMFYGMLGVTGLAFSCSTEFIPEINEKLKLVKFETSFKITLTIIMILDYIGCYIVEYIFKKLFFDNRPKDIVKRISYHDVKKNNKNIKK
ncbi:hypothetical protein PNEG_03193 [Pneumocystis murina B123]|uniref:Cation-transporting ATPase n=1 Tax=Pneumocystis murina (strain B123) TaxID=1069680 RepID=M7NIF5_PNEMU|nr:hypothetical protein PNEG_03193 [Pneumocystis murina B123]EMR08353.1 hypothetical protein PNEG_03193 [Pneumocystis murina B123]